MTGLLIVTICTKISDIMIALQMVTVVSLQLLVLSLSLSVEPVAMGQLSCAVC